MRNMPNKFRRILDKQGWQGRLDGAPMGGRSPGDRKIEAAYIGFRTTFNNRLGKGESFYRQLATVVETDNVLDRQIWLNSTPRMKRWLGDKTLTMLTAESLPIVTSPHEASLVIPKQDLINDRYGLYTDKIGQMADAFDWANDELYFGMLAAGIQGVALGTTYDGQNLIDVDHTTLSTGGTNQSNKVTGALSVTTYQQARQRYWNFQDENGIPLNVGNRRMNLIVGPANYDVANLIINQTTGATGAQNVERGTANLVVSPWLTAGTRKILGVPVTLTGLEWFMVPDNSSAIIIQHKRAPEFLSVEDGEFPFRTGKFLYGIEAEFGAAYGLWQEIVGGPGV